jgi:hypothetical protein
VGRWLDVEGFGPGYVEKFNRVLFPPKFDSQHRIVFLGGNGEAQEVLLRRRKRIGHQGWNRGKRFSVLEKKPSEEEARQLLADDASRRMMTALLNGLDLSYVINYRHLELDDTPFAAGGGGEVYRGRMHGSDVAIKVLHSEKISGCIEDLVQEVKMLARVKCPNVISFFGVSHHNGPPPSSFFPSSSSSSAPTPLQFPHHASSRRFLLNTSYIFTVILPCSKTKKA